MDLKREHELGQTAEARKRTDRDLRCIGWGLVLLGVLMPALVTVENTGIYRTLMNGIYQGQEIGMENCAFPDIDAYDDISTLDDYRVCLDAGCTKEQALELAHRFSRDNARTPVQWSDDKYAGFSTQEPWLMVNPDYKEINVKKQEKEPDSELAFFK